jgi:cell division protease FtsH
VQKKGKDRGRTWISTGAWALFLAIPALLVFWMFTRDGNVTNLKYGELIQVLNAAQKDPSISLQKVKVGQHEIRGEVVTNDLVTDGQSNGRRTQTAPFHTLRTGLQDDQALHQLLKAAAPTYQAEDEESAVKNIYSLASGLFLFVALGLTVFLVLRWVSGGSSPLTFGRSRHKVYAQKDYETTFKDVAGIEEAMAELREVVDFLKKPQKYQALGGRIPKGVLLVGPPGTGKTLLAKAVAGEAHVPFFSMSGSDFVEMFVGVGAARVRDLFGQAESKAPCIIFIDELDALGKSRGGPVMGGHDEREQTLNQLLVEMDGFDSNRGVILMAATNRPETLDAALLRPGRFDRTVVVDRPDINGREAILKVHVRGAKLGPDVDLRRIAALTPGAVGADLANLVNEAALMAARGGKEHISMAEFEEAVERGAVGLERKSRVMHADEKQRVAYHEAGHALVACALPNTYPVHKVSIIPRGVGALGYVLSRPDEDRYLMTRSELESQIKVALGGTLSEELVYREISNGATSDLEHASKIARAMVREFGMSRLGRINYKEQGGPNFLGTGGNRGDYSEQTAREIDLEVRKIIEDATEEVRTILESRRDALEALAQRLMEKEVIDGAELRQLLEQHHAGLKLVPGTLVVEEPEPGAPVAGDIDQSETAGPKSGIVGAGGMP